jgi:hypothetical protein
MSVKRNINQALTVARILRKRGVQSDEAVAAQAAQDALEADCSGAQLARYALKAVDWNGFQALVHDTIYRSNSFRAEVVESRDWGGKS